MENRAENLHWQKLTLDKRLRAAIKGQAARCIWLTGYSGAGKTTLANNLEQKLYEMGRHTYVIDGDNLRHGLNQDLGFSDDDRSENIRRVAEVSRLMVDAGLIVITSFISPFKKQRAFARSLFEEGEFFEVFVDCPLEVCESRDPKGLYKMARRGEIDSFTGINSAYEPPEAPEIHVKTSELDIETSTNQICDLIAVSNRTQSE